MGILRTPEEGYAARCGGGSWRWAVKTVQLNGAEVLPILLAVGLILWLLDGPYRVVMVCAGVDAVLTIAAALCIGRWERSERRRVKRI